MEHETVLVMEISRLKVAHITYARLLYFLASAGEIESEYFKWLHMFVHLIKLTARSHFTHTKE